MKKILFPTDFSDLSDNAYVYALEFSRIFESTIYALHAYRYPEMPPHRLSATVDDFMSYIDEEKLQEYHTRLASLDRIAINQRFTPDLRHLLIRKSIKKAIYNTIESENINLIVMGTAGHDRFWKHFGTTKTAEVMENARCMTLCIPSKATFDGKLDKVVFATDFSDDNQKALDLFLPICEQLGAQLDVLNIDFSNASVGEIRMQEFKDRYAMHDFVHFVIEKGENFTGSIQEYALSNGVDFFVMQTSQRKAVEEFFSWSFTKDLAFHSKVPVLAIPNTILV